MGKDEMIDGPSIVEKPVKSLGRWYNNAISTIDEVNW